MILPCGVDWAWAPTPGFGSRQSPAISTASSRSSSSTRAGSPSRRLSARSEPDTFTACIEGSTRLGISARAGKGAGRAATIAGGDGSFLSHRASAEAQSLLKSAGRRIIDVTAVTENGRRRPGLRIHRAKELRRGETTFVEGIRCSSPARAIIEIAGTEPRFELERAIRAGESRRILRADEVGRILAWHPNAPGHALIVELLRLRDPTEGKSRSDLEDHLLRTLQPVRVPAAGGQREDRGERGAPRGRLHLAASSASQSKPTGGNGMRASSPQASTRCATGTSRSQGGEFSD